MVENSRNISINTIPHSPQHGESLHNWFASSFACDWSFRPDTSEGHAYQNLHQ